MEMWRVAAFEAVAQWLVLHFRFKRLHKLGALRFYFILRLRSSDICVLETRLQHATIFTVYDIYIYTYLYTYKYAV